MPRLDDYPDYPDDFVKPDKKPRIEQPPKADPPKKKYKRYSKKTKGEAFGEMGEHKVHCRKCGYTWRAHFNAPRHWIRCGSCQAVLRSKDVYLNT